MRGTERDGAANRLEFHVLTHYEPLWKLLSRPRLRGRVNRVLINSAIGKVPTRPNPLSTLAPYTSWSSLTDRSYDARHLPPHGASDLPPAEAVADLFVRRGEAVLCAKSTVTFAYFAQWFTDGFLRSDRSVERDPRRNDATHEIDLLPVYGVRPSWTEQLRAHEGGRLKSQTIGGAEFPPYLCEDGETKPEFSEIKVVRPDQIPPERRDTLFAAGSDTMNSQIGFVMMGTLFLREHNRIAGALGARVHRVGRRTPVPDRAQHPDRGPDQARDRGVHQPHRAVPLQARRRPGAVQERALVPHELDGDRVQPALPLARADPEPA